MISRSISVALVTCFFWVATNNAMQEPTHLCEEFLNIADPEGLTAVDSNQRMIFMRQKIQTSFGDNCLEQEKQTALEQCNDGGFFDISADIGFGLLGEIAKALKEFDGKGYFTRQEQADVLHKLNFVNVSLELSISVLVQQLITIDLPAGFVFKIEEGLRKNSLTLASLQAFYEKVSSYHPQDSMPECFDEYFDSGLAD